MNHLVSDSLIRIKNAALARKREVDLPFSNINREIVKTLIREGFLSDIKETNKENRRTLSAVIKYEKRLPVLTDIIVVSKPSLRVYKESKAIASVERKGKHKVILSTSQGVMSGGDAKKKGIGGELLFEIW